MAVPPFPTSLTNTKSAQVCGSHGGLAGIFCPDALHNGYLVLVWDWAGDTHWPKADGFRVYQVDGGQHKLVDTENNGQQTISFQKPGPGGFGGKCYAVTAFVGATESDSGASFCVGTGYAGVQTMTLRATAMENHSHEYHNSGLAPVDYCDDLCIGWLHQTVLFTGTTINEPTSSSMPIRSTV